MEAFDFERHYKSIKLDSHFHPATDEDTSTTMSTTITKAVCADIPTIVALRAAAYANDRLHQLGLPGPTTPDQKREYQQYQLDSMYLRFEMPNRNYFKAVEESSGRIVGFSCWNAPEREAKGNGGSGKVMPELPGFVDKKKFDDVGKSFTEAKGKIVGGRDDYWCMLSFFFATLGSGSLLWTDVPVDLQAMCVLPEWQGRGIGDQLLKQGLHDLVDRDGLDCYLEASEAGAKLYERNRFSPEISIPIEVKGGTYTVKAMLRKAAS